MNEPRINYRVRFRGRPDLDSDSFSDYVGRMEVGQPFNREGEMWRIAEIVPGEAGERDLVVFERGVES